MAGEGFLGCCVKPQDPSNPTLFNYKLLLAAELFPPALSPDGARNNLLIPMLAPLLLNPGQGFSQLFNVCAWCVRHRTILSKVDTSRNSLPFSCQVLWKHIQNDKWYAHLLTSISLEMFHWVILQVSWWQLGGPSFVSPSHPARLQGSLELSVSSVDTACCPRSADSFPCQCGITMPNSKYQGVKRKHLVTWLLPTTTIGHQA